MNVKNNTMEIDRDLLLEILNAAELSDVCVSEKDLKIVRALLGVGDD